MVAGERSRPRLSSRLRSEPRRFPASPASDDGQLRSQCTNSASGLAWWFKGQCRCIRQAIAKWTCPSLHPWRDAGIDRKGGVAPPRRFAPLRRWTRDHSKLLNVGSGGPPS
jgi:hypothetical protein